MDDRQTPSALGPFFGVLIRPRTYANLLYLLLSLPLALVYALMLGSSAALGAALSIVGVGLLILLGCLVAAWGFATFERELAIGLLGVDIPPMSLPHPERRSEWRRLREHLGRSVTWKSLAFLLLKLPFGILAATAIAVLVGGSLALIVAANSVLLSMGGPFDLPRMFGGDLLLVLGVLLLTASLHAVNWVARGWGALAVVMLGIGQEELQLWEAQRRADAADRSRRELILNVSHDLRTPIASIRGHIDTLSMPAEQRPVDADPEQYLKVVSEEARRLEALVQDLLELARSDSDRVSVMMRPVELRPLLSGVVAAAAPLARRERGVTVAHADPLRSLVVLADGDRLTQVLTNLVRNGVNHTPEGGAVYLQAGELTPGWAFVDVSDTGHGIPADELERVFERFYRGDPSRSRESGGFGLGLSVSRDLTAAMGGGITVTSDPGVGSTFRVTLRTASPGSPAPVRGG
ncbi:MAG: HAMP domain-containing histidine kinase [Candidatus Dormibacteraeota bacterium]|nr:HAMP domain-containing histidine kinase [Candidatus Dormibacteraeota bacterium]